MSIMTVMPRESRDWTVDDLDRLPDDGLQYELLDGLLLVTPTPVREHQRLARGVFRLLDAACTDEFEVFFAPLDWRPDERTSLQPDVLVATLADPGEKSLSLPLPLAVEVLSPSTRRKDLVLKHSKYADAGVRCYWVVDPEGPAVTAFELRDGAYVQVATATGDESFQVQTPFPVTVTPSALR